MYLYCCGNCRGDKKNSALFFFSLMLCPTDERDVAKPRVFPRFTLNFPTLPDTAGRPRGKVGRYTRLGG